MLGFDSGFQIVLGRDPSAVETQISSPGLT